MEEVMLEVEMSLPAARAVAIQKDRLAIGLGVSTSGLLSDRVWL